MKAVFPPRILTGIRNPEALRHAWPAFSPRFSRRFARPTLLEAVEPRRVVDEDAVARRLVRDPLGEETQQVAVVRHRHLEPDMRPVAAPEQPVGPRLDELPGE